MTTPSLFPLPDAPSPRLRWLERHGVRTHDHGAPGLDEVGGDYERWSAGTGEPSPDTWRGGPTEDDAIAAWARANGVRMWNEEGA